MEKGTGMNSGGAIYMENTVQLTFDTTSISSCTPESIYARDACTINGKEMGTRSSYQGDISSESPYDEAKWTTRQ